MYSTNQWKKNGLKNSAIGMYTARQNSLHKHLQKDLLEMVDIITAVFLFLERASFIKKEKKKNSNS